MRLEQPALAIGIVGDVVAAPIAIEEQRLAASFEFKSVLGSREGVAARIAFRTDRNSPRLRDVLPGWQQALLFENSDALLSLAGIGGSYERRAELIDQRLHHAVHRLHRRQRHRSPEIFGGGVAPRVPLQIGADAVAEGILPHPLLDHS